MITRFGLFGVGRGAGEGRGGQDKRGRRHAGYNALSAHLFLGRHLMRLWRCIFSDLSIGIGVSGSANSRCFTLCRR